MTAVLADVRSKTAIGIAVSFQEIKRSLCIIFQQIVAAIPSNKTKPDAANASP
jgi:hypothetical protein